MEIRDYLKILRVNWIVIVACTVLGLIGGAVVAATTTPKYEASTELYLSVRSTTDATSSQLVQSAALARQAITSYLALATTDIVLDPVVQELGLAQTSADLSEMVAATSPLNTVIIRIAVTADDPDLVAAVANAVGSNLANAVENNLEKPDGADSLFQLETVQVAIAPESAANTPLRQNLLVGAFLGFIAGLVLAVVRNVLDTRVRSAQDIDALVGKPVLGEIAFDREAAKRPLAVHADPHSARAESFRKLRTNLQYRQNDAIAQSYVVTSPLPGVGKSSTAANLAISLAATGARVALVDGDLRRPRIAQYMDIDGAVGLGDILIGRASLADTIRRLGRTQLYVLPSGKIPPNPSELLGSNEMERLLKALTDEMDFVIVDAPPLLLVTDAAVVSMFTGGSILVAAAGRTTKDQVVEAVDVLDAIGDSLLGVIVTMVPAKGMESHSFRAQTYGTTRSFDEADAPKRSRL